MSITTPDQRDQVTREGTRVNWEPRAKFVTRSFSVVDEEKKEAVEAQNTHTGCNYLPMLWPDHVITLRCDGSRPRLCNNQFIIDNWWSPQQQMQFSTIESPQWPNGKDWLINSRPMFATYIKECHTVWALPGIDLEGLAVHSTRRSRWSDLCDKFDRNLTSLRTIKAPRV